MKGFTLWCINELIVESPKEGTSVGDSIDWKVPVLIYRNKFLLEMFFIAPLIYIEEQPCLFSMPWTSCLLFLTE